MGMLYFPPLYQIGIVPSSCSNVTARPSLCVKFDALACGKRVHQKETQKTKL